MTEQWLDVIPIPIIIIRPTTGAVLYMNPAFRDMPHMEHALEMITTAPLLVQEQVFPHEMAASSNPIIYDGHEALLIALRHDEKLHNLKQSNRELQAYAYTVAHDLKTPVTVILGYVDLLEVVLEKNLAKAQTYVGRIRETSEQMVKIIQQLLWAARLQNSNQPFVCVDVNEVVNGALKRFQESIHKIRVEIHTPLPAVMGHPAWIEEVFANLISNAIKYIGQNNPAPLIQIRGIPQGKEVRFEVKDNGIGIAPEDQARIFEMFTRLNTIDQEGSGIGLSIVYRIVTRLGGKIGVESNGGSLFWFTLPAAE